MDIRFHIKDNNQDVAKTIGYSFYYLEFAQNLKLRGDVIVGGNVEMNMLPKFSGNAGGKTAEFLISRTDSID